MAAWGKCETGPVKTINFAEIMSEEYAQQLHSEELKRCGKEIDRPTTTLPDETQKSSETTDGWEDYSSLLDPDKPIPDDPPNLLRDCDSDEVLAHILQSQFDREYNEELNRIEKKQNQKSKVKITLDNFLRGELKSKDFVNNDKGEDKESYDDDNIELMPQCFVKVKKTREMVEKHDVRLRDECSELSLDNGNDLCSTLSTQACNQLKSISRRASRNAVLKKTKMRDRKENIATAEMGLDATIRLLLYKLINNQTLEQIDGIVSTGKEAVILHAVSDPEYVPLVAGGSRLPKEEMPKECAIKIFKVTLNDFKQRDRYIKDDYRFKDRFNVRFSKQNTRVIINLWAEKEMHNLMRMQSIGIKCPTVVILKKNVLVMSFIGENNIAAPKLRDAELNTTELSLAYEEIVSTMYKLYNEANLVHADLSEYNILWYKGECWFIDVAQSVEPSHPSALEFLMRDCDNIVTFFTKRGLSNIYTKEELFEHISSMNVEENNAAMLERIHTRGENMKQAAYFGEEEDERKPAAFPFDLAWEKSSVDRVKQTKLDHEIANFTQTLLVLHDNENKQ